MNDPHKLSSIMWSRTKEGHMIPHELHDRVDEIDAENLDQVFDALMTFRKITPALTTIRRLRWQNMSLIRDYLIASMSGRSEARSMIANGDWEAFWLSCN